jgi:hypothetical protein
MPKARWIALCLVVSMSCVPLLAQSAADNLLERIRKEEATNSQIMKTMHMLADVYGPRLTGSPNHKHAAEWAVKQMTEWGLQNAHLEAWDFGHPGWLNERLTAHMLSPIKDVLTCEVLAWRKSSKPKYSPATRKTSSKSLSIQRKSGASHQSLCDFIAHRSRFAAYSVTTECHYNACLYNLRNLWMG